MNKAKPCAHCGEKAQVVVAPLPQQFMQRQHRDRPPRDGDFVACVKCSKCGIRTESICGNTSAEAEEKALAVWNKRKA